MSSSLVKSMINVFENFSYTNSNNEPAKLTKMHRTKSTGSINPAFRRSREHRPEPQTNLDLVQIEHQVRHLNNTLNNYKTYNRENHIYYQNQIFFILTDIINIDARDEPYTVSRKSELIEILKRLNVALNSHLPSVNKSSNGNYVELPPPVVKHVKKVEEKQNVTKKVQQQIPKQESVDRGEKSEEEDQQVPSVKTLKQLWEKNIIHNEKKAKENENVKVSPQVLIKLDVASDSKYIPYSERLKKHNSIDILETPVDMYEQSVQVGSFYSMEFNEDDKPEDISQDSLSDHSDEDSDNVYEVHVNGDDAEA